MLATTGLEDPENRRAGGLNVNEVDQTIEIVAKVRSEWPITVVLIGHVMRFLAALCDLVVIIHHGRKIYEAPISGLTRRLSVRPPPSGSGTRPTSRPAMHNALLLPLLEIDRISAGYGSFTVLRDVSIRIHGDTVAGIIGSTATGMAKPR